MTPPEPSTPKPLLSIRSIEIVAFLLLGIGIIVALIGIIAFSWDQPRLTTDLKADTSRLSNMGSFLSGTVGIVWSLASVILFYLALKEQRRDIKINQDALNLQIKELEDTRMVYVDQSNTFKTQGFENTFFQLLQLHASTVKDLGKDVFIQWKMELDWFSKGFIPNVGENEYGYVEEPKANPFANFEEIRNELEITYKVRYKEFENTLNHYFRQLYHIFKYVHLSPLIPDDKRAFYTSLIRAQLSQNELYAIVYNSLIPGYGSPKFLFLIKQYDVVKNFNPTNIPDPIIWEFFKAERESVSDPFMTSD